MKIGLRNHLAVCGAALCSVMLTATACFSPEPSAVTPENKQAPATKQKQLRLQLATMHGSQFKIFVAKRFTLPEMTAAQEIQKVMRDIASYGKERTGEIITMDTRPSGNGIIIGDVESPLIRDLVDRLGLKDAGTADDIIVQAVIDGNLILAGNTPRAALYSAYDFLQRQFGVVWAFDGEDGTFCTKNDVSIPMDFFRTHKNGFRYRNMGYASRTGDDRKYFNARNFAHEGDFRFGGERYYGGETIQPYRSDFKDHPEYFAMRDGKRYLPPPGGWSWVINGCWSNEGFTDLCLKRIKEGIRKNLANHISLHPADDMRRCECDECKKMIDPDASSRFFKYNARLLREIKKEFPDLRYSVLAYQEYRDVPACDVEEVEFVEYCQYSRCFIHKIGNPTCETNKEDFARLERWEKEKNIPLGIWDYTFDVFQPGYNMPVYSYMADQIRNFHSRNFVKLFIEGGPCLKFSRPARFVAMQLMWDPALDEETVLENYCRAIYGPAAKVMLNYHRESAKFWDAMNAHLTGCFNNPGGTSKLYLTPALRELAAKTFAEAEKQLDKFTPVGQIGPKDVHKLRKAALAEKYKKAVAFEKDTYNEWLKLHEKMMQSSIQISAYQEQFADLAKAPGTPLMTRNKKPTAKKATAAIAWLEDAILIRVEADNDTPAPAFKRNKDGKMAYGGDSVELFIQAPGAKSYFQFAAGRNGDYYDGEAMNGNWNGEWTHNVINDTKNKKLIYEITIPFKNFGVTTPGNESWKIMVIHNCVPALGLPFPGHHDIGSAADVTFATGKRP